jgi:predicted enzyme related to lactoylglutathione lyase
MKANPIGWFEIYVQNMERAQAFYESLLEGHLEALPAPGGPESLPMQMMAFPMDMAQHGAAGALVKMDGVPSGGGGTLVYFSCLDCAAAAERAKAAGGQILQERTAIGPYGFIAMVVDTEGNPIGLHSTQ